MEAWKPGLLLGFSCILSHLGEVSYQVRVFKDQRCLITGLLSVAIEII